MSSKTISSYITPDKVDLNNFNADLESQQVRVDSEILHPISNTNTGTNDYVKFVIENKGILSPKSKIQFCGTTTGTYADNVAFYPMLTGGIANIRSARLMVGNRTIATSERYNQFFATQRGLVRPCKRLGVDAVRHLTNDSYKVVVKADGTKNNGVGVYTGELDMTGGYEDVVFNTFSQIGSTSNGSPTWSVSLEELFPFMADNLDIPLFVLKPNEQVVLQIDLQNDSELGDRSVRDYSNDQYDKTLMYVPDVKMICDFVYFNQDRMDDIMNSYRVNGDLVEYVDLQLVEQSLQDLAADTQNTQKIILTGTNRVCRGLFATYQQNQGTTRNYVQNVLGNYFSENIATRRAFNLTINNQQLLVSTPSDITDSQMYYYYSTWNGNLPAFIPKPLYDIGNTQMTDNVVNGIANSNLQGKNSPMGISFGNQGFAINSVPIQMTLVREQGGTATKNRIYVWCLIRRMFSINNNGSVSVSY